MIDNHQLQVKWRYIIKHNESSVLFWCICHFLAYIIIKEISLFAMHELTICINRWSDYRWDQLVSVDWFAASLTEGDRSGLVILLRNNRTSFCFCVPTWRHVISRERMRDRNEPLMKKWNWLVNRAWWHQWWPIVFYVTNKKLNCFFIWHEMSLDLHVDVSVWFDHTRVYDRYTRVWSPTSKGYGTHAPQIFAWPDIFLRTFPRGQIIFLRTQRNICVIPRIPRPRINSDWYLITIINISSPLLISHHHH